MSSSLFRGLAAAVLAASLSQTPLFAQQAPPPAGAPQADDPHTADELVAQRQALGFLGYLDQGRYADSYAYTGMLIRSQLDRDAFAAQIQKAREGTGALQSRELMDSSYTTNLPGAPEGQYVVLHYHASFANRPEAVETVTLAFAKGYWRIVGYYIK
jgi:serine/threonine-protein kinase